VAQFQFVGLPVSVQMPTRFLDAGTRAQVVGANHLILGPEAILPAQRLVLLLGQRRLELQSDGLGPFSDPAAASAAASSPSS
jgi:general secretion pathway protein H